MRRNAGKIRFCSVSAGATRGKDRGKVMDPDLALLQRWRAGERNAGEQLFARHFAGIYRFFEHKVGAEADELTQRTFLACVTAREQFRSDSSFRTYLFTIARHELYAHLKVLARSKQIDGDVSSIAEIVTSPSSQLGRGQQVELLRAALLELPVEQQLLLELHYWHELDAAALAEVFAATPSTIRVRLLRSRQALRELLATSGALLPPSATDRLAASLSEHEMPENEK